MSPKAPAVEAPQAFPTTTREEEILIEATRVFAQNGFRATDVQIIADALGIGKGTIYRSFPTKQALFLACADRAMTRLQESIRGASLDCTDPIELIKAVIRAYLKFFDDNSELLELIIQERSEFKDREKPTYFEHKDRCVQQWLDLFAELIAHGRVRDVDPEQISKFISQQLYGKLFTHYFTGKKEPLANGADEVIDFLFHGLMTDHSSARSRE
ncbi:MAG TPA: TetR/AcrR family transcriptional regulator [Planktothrix sp.]|jgi:AcrR family transcriptional regulator